LVNMSFLVVSLSHVTLFFINLPFIFINFISQSSIWKYLIILVTNLKWAMDCLVCHPFSKLYEKDFMVIGQELSELRIGRYEFKPGCDEEAECAVCLCKIEQGEEIKELRCKHLFHRDCLDRWVDYKHDTCPLCRDFIAPRTAIGEVGEVLLFKFWFFSSNNRETWWLR
ncbi:RING-H2 finger protein ATL47-like, partial [Quillaja saponaria]